MKILHYIPSLDEYSGGVGAYIQLVARDLGKLCELHILTHKSDYERNMDKDNLLKLDSKKNVSIHFNRREVAV